MSGGCSAEKGVVPGKGAVFPGRIKRIRPFLTRSIPRRGQKRVPCLRPSPFYNRSAEEILRTSKLQRPGALSDRYYREVRSGVEPHRFFLGKIPAGLKVQGRLFVLAPNRQAVFYVRCRKIVFSGSFSTGKQLFSLLFGTNMRSNRRGAWCAIPGNFAVWTEVHIRQFCIFIAVYHAAIGGIAEVVILGRTLWCAYFPPSRECSPKSFARFLRFSFESGTKEDSKGGKGKKLRRFFFFWSSKRPRAFSFREVLNF